MDVIDAAGRWAGVWERAWAAKDVETILRFDADGMVVDHRAYWNQLDRREPPFDGW